jgi:hypothetical protein
MAVSQSDDAFIPDVVLPAFADIRKKLESKKRMVVVEHTATEAMLMSTYHAQLDIRYTISIEASPQGAHPVVQTAFRDPLTGKDRVTEHESIGDVGAGATTKEVSKDDIVDDFFRNYRPDTASEEKEGYRLQPGDLL